MRRDLIITLPAKVQWSEYAQELTVVADEQSVLNFRLPSLPNESGVGARCYLVYRGEIIGYMLISGLLKRDGFTCATTGNYWRPGPYVQRNGPFYFFHPHRRPLRKGFQGYGYYHNRHEGETFYESYHGYFPTNDNSQQSCSKKVRTEEAAAV